MGIETWMKKWNNYEKNNKQWIGNVNSVWKRDECNIFLKLSTKKIIKKNKISEVIISAIN